MLLVLVLGGKKYTLFWSSDYFFVWLAAGRAIIEWHYFFIRQFDENLLKEQNYTFRCRHHGPFLLSCTSLLRASETSTNIDVIDNRHPYMIEESLGHSSILQISEGKRIPKECDASRPILRFHCYVGLMEKSNKCSLSCTPWRDQKHVPRIGKSYGTSRKAFTFHTFLPSAAARSTDTHLRQPWMCVALLRMRRTWSSGVVKVPMNTCVRCIRFSAWMLNAFHILEAAAEWESEKIMVHEVQ